MNNRSWKERLRGWHGSIYYVWTVGWSRLGVPGGLHRDLIIGMSGLHRDLIIGMSGLHRLYCVWIVGWNRLCGLHRHLIIGMSGLHWHHTRRDENSSFYSVRVIRLSEGWRTLTVSLSLPSPEHHDNNKEDGKGDNRCKGDDENCHVLLCGMKGKEQDEFPGVPVPASAFSGIRPHTMTTGRVKKCYLYSRRPSWCAILLMPKTESSLFFFCFDLCGSFFSH